MRVPTSLGPVILAGGCMEPAKLLRVQEVAHLLTISVREVWRRADSGDLPKPLRLGGKVRRWLREEIEAIIERAKRQRGA